MKQVHSIVQAGYSVLRQFIKREMMGLWAIFSLCFSAFSKVSTMNVFAL